MDKIKKSSLKWAFVKYISPCIVVSVIGILIIGHGTNYLQDWYYTKHVYSMGGHFEKYNIIEFDNYRFTFQLLNCGKETIMYWIISNAQFLLMPLWVLFCVGMTGMIFYNTELREPINRLLSASKKISENQLDFKIEYRKQNELGTLCSAFDEMRLALYNNNLEMWKSIEERKRLNSAFSHDLRIPLTVLHGYADFLQKYVPEGKVSQEKLVSVLSMMSGQITRLEHYTVKMNAVQKLEDIIPKTQDFTVEELRQNIMQTGKLLCKDKEFELVISVPDDVKTLETDPEIVMQVYENIVSNAVRYADSKVTAFVSLENSRLSLSVCDDGNGFSDEALEKAAAPFFRDEKNEDKTHFGLGLYICRLLCGKCGGSLSISNGIKGGKVTAEFSCGKISDNR